MKIGFVLDDTLDSTDGVQQYVLALGSWLSAAGHEVHYLVGETSRTDLPHIHSLAQNIGVRFNGNRMTMPLPASRRRIRALLSTENFDVLHVQVPYSPFMAGRIVQAAPAGTAVVGTFHIAPHSGVVRLATRILAAISRSSLRRFNVMLSVSVAARDFAMQTYGVESTVLPNVVDLARFANAQPIALSGDGPVVLYLGRLVPRKGCQLLLQAVERLLKTDTERKLRVIICGRGPLEPALRRYVSEHGIADYVQFAGFVSEADKPRYLKAADVAVFPSSGGESFGIVLLEAMAAGSPVVLGANNAGYATVLGPRPQQLFQVDDAAALAATMRVYLDDATARTEALHWQSGYVPSFDTGVVADRLLEVYASARPPLPGL